MYVAWQCAQLLRSAYQAGNLADGRRIAQKILAAFPTCPIPEITRRGNTLTQRREAFLGLLRHRPLQQRRHRAIHGLIGLHRRIAPGLRNRHNYRLRMLLLGGGLPAPT